MSAGEILALIGFLAVVVCATLLAYRVQGFKYAVDRESLLMQSNIFGVVPITMRIPLDSIIELRKVTLKECILASKGSSWPILWGMPRRKMVLVVKKTGFFKKVFISPQDPEQLIAVLSGRITTTSQEDST